jgi:hypothetical protein
MFGKIIDSVFERFEVFEDGWSAPIPNEFQFLDRPLMLRIQTEPIKSLNPRKPNEQELALARTVLANLEDILPIVEEEFALYHEDFPEFIEDAVNPHVWISCDALEYDGPERWSFIVEAAKNEFYGTHIVFDGIQFLETWAGD